MLFGARSVDRDRRWRDVAILAAGFVAEGVHVDLPDGLFGLDAPVCVSGARQRELLSGGGVDDGSGLRPRERSRRFSCRRISPNTRLSARRWDRARCGRRGSGIVGQLTCRRDRACISERWSRAFQRACDVEHVSRVRRPGARRRRLQRSRNTADPRFRMCVVAAAGCAAVSFAPLLPFYRALHEAIPLFQAVACSPSSARSCC